jgi:putative membrane-bound dehydrogenase-like protein
MNRPLLLTSLSLAALHFVHAKELEGVYKPTQNPCPSVEEAIAKMKVPDGYEVRNFAAEPMVVNPVAMTWDHRGRLWVVELYEYPRGAKNPNEYSKTATDENFRPVVKADANSPRDKVVVLEDTDNDGKADKRTVFAEGLNLATAVLCGYGGVFVGQAPNMFFFRDTNGDDKADEYKTVLTGFGLEDRHELLNSFCWGPDGYMYFTHGVFTHSKVRRPGEDAGKGNTLNAGVYRVKFTADRSKAVPALKENEQGRDGLATAPAVAFHEVYADGTSNPWGVDFDARGNAFVEACVIDHLYHMAPGGIYSRQGGAPENPYAYELLPSIVPKDHPRHFRAAYAGIQIYQGGIYPADTHGHVFFGNIHDNAIHEEALEPVGATFKAKPVRDFLRANDGWFRPVSIQTGPDGFLWVMDWCDKYPCYQNAQANPEGVDREKGRIWRVCYTGSDEGKKLAGMSRKSNQPSETSEEDVRWKSIWRHMRDAYAEKPLEAIARDRAAQITQRAAAVQWLAEAGQLSRQTIAELVADESTEIRIATARAMGISWHWCQMVVNQSPPRTLITENYYYDLEPRLAQLANDHDPAVRAEAVIAMRRADTGHLTLERSSKLPSYCLHGQAVLANAISKSSNDDDRTLAFHIWMALQPRLARKPQDWLPWLADLAPKTKPLSQVLTYKSARRITDTRSAENMDLLLGFLDKIKADDVLTAHALDGMLKAQEAGALKPAKYDPAPLFAHWRASKAEDVRNLAGRIATLWGDPNAVAALMGVVLDEKADVQKRIESIRTVRRLKSDAARAGMLKLLEQKSPDILTVEVLRAAGELGGNDLASAILKAWQGYSAPVKTAAAEVLVTRGDWAARLLDAVEGKWVSTSRLNPSDIPVSVRRSLAQNNELKGRAQQLLGAWNETAADVKALIAAKKKAALTGEPNMENGKIIFTATCATCHKFHGGGQEVGPELIGNGRSNIDALLANVIDPNQIIGNGYENFIVTTKDGRAVAGRVIEDTPTQMTLLGIGGVKTVVPRGDIQKAENTKQSLMPMGLGALPDADFRDLVWYVLAPPEEGPLTKEKKESLVLSLEGKDQSDQTERSNGSDLWNPKHRDRESASLWNVDWQLDAPDFEGTPTKLVEYHGRKNVLVLHPKSRTEASALVRTLELPADKPVKVSVWVASHDGGDWDIHATANGERLAGSLKVANTGKDRWKKQTWDLSAYKGKKVTLRIENWASDWMNEFSYWSDLKVE